MKDWFNGLPKPARIIVGLAIIALFVGILGALSGCTKPGMTQDVFPHHEAK